jgi:hypothetical protein
MPLLLPQPWVALFTFIPPIPTWGTRVYVFDSNTHGGRPLDTAAPVSALSSGNQTGTLPHNGGKEKKFVRTYAIHSTTYRESKFHLRTTFSSDCVKTHLLIRSIQANCHFGGISLPTYLSTYLPTYLPTYLSTYLPLL